MPQLSEELWNSLGSALIFGILKLNLASLITPHTVLRCVRLRTSGHRVFSITILYCNMKGSDEIIQIKYIDNFVRYFKEEKNK